MPTIITGLASNVTTPLAATVSGASNATPIVITTPANHLYATGDRVSVAGVLGNTAANGLFLIVVISSTTFSLTGSVGNGAYVSGGVCADYSMTPQTTLPSDGDAFNAAAWNVSISTALDRTQALAAQGAPLPTLAALAAITTPANGTLRHVLGFGWFVFQTSATTGLTPFRVAAADTTTGGWVSSTAHETAITRYVPVNRVVGITGAAQTPALVGPYQNFTTAGVPLFLGAGAFQGAAASASTTAAWGFLLPIDQWLVQGATLTGVVLAYTPSFSGSLPTPGQAVQFGVMASPRSGFSVGTQIPLSLLSTTFVIDSGGAKVAGTTRTVTLTPDQNSTIDLSTNSYGIAIYDEHGTGALAGNTFHLCTLTLSNVADARR